MKFNKQKNEMDLKNLKMKNLQRSPGAAGLTIARANLHSGLLLPEAVDESPN